MRSDMYNFSINTPIMDGLNPTLDWICALTSKMEAIYQKQLGLNPTLDWICALTKNTLTTAFPSKS